MACEPRKLKVVSLLRYRHVALGKGVKRYVSKWHIEQSILSMYLSTIIKVIINLISQETYICYNIKDKNNGKPNSIQRRVTQSQSFPIQKQTLSHNTKHWLNTCQMSTTLLGTYKDD